MLRGLRALGACGVRDLELGKALGDALHGKLKTELSAEEAGPLGQAGMPGKAKGQRPGQARPKAKGQRPGQARPGRQARHAGRQAGRQAGRPGMQAGQGAQLGSWGVRLSPSLSFSFWVCLNKYIYIYIYIYILNTFFYTNMVSTPARLQQAVSPVELLYISYCIIFFYSKQTCYDIHILIYFLYVNTFKFIVDGYMI